MRATLAVHGGAGGGGEPQLEGVRAALAAGVEILAEGGSALDATVIAVVTLEADGGFNAGRGSVRTVDGGIELDAAVMRGSDRAAGAVAAMTGVRHPILVARALLDEGGALLLAGNGANAFAARRGFEAAPDDWFTAPAVASPHGTVGAVACDHAGQFAVATSTGGVRGQAAGRVGDTPMIGGGTYANARVAISATGKGEAFMRAVFAHSIAHDVAHGVSLREACARALADVAGLGGRGGCVAVDANGNVALSHNTKVMPAGWATTNGDLYVALEHL